MRSHGAVASRALGAEVTDAVLADLDSAPIDEKLRSTLRFLKLVTSAPDFVGPEDVRRLHELGVTDQMIEDALAVAFCFNLITRLADAFGWYIPDQAGFDASGRSLLERGYLMPMRAKPAS
jgi:alkylhydroperoxidase family enzyme